MMVGFYGTHVDENSTIVKEIKKYHIGGIIFDNHRLPNSKKITTNIENPTQLKKLISDLQYYAKKYHDYPLLIAVNQEGGIVNTLKTSQDFYDDHDSEAELGKRNNLKLTYMRAYHRGLMLKKLGINLNLAPVADLNINPDNPAVAKLQRSFGNNLAQVTKDLAVTRDAYKKTNTLCTLKHFPGLGSANKNTDYDNADVTQTWRHRELIPYKRLIQSNQICPFIMVTHLINRKLASNNEPVSLAKKVVTDLLIKKLHFQGVIITDDMDAAAIRKNYPADIAIKKAVLAGNNMIIFGGTQGFDPDEDTKILFNTLITLAKNNNKIRQHVQHSYNKIIAVKQSID